MADRVFKVMVSSTFRDLRECRDAVRDAILGLGMLPLMMEHDAAIPDRGIITNSLAKVDEADAYVVLISNQPLEYELAIRRLLAEHAAKQRSDSLPN